MLAFAGLMLSLNFLYMVRKFVLGVLISVSPMVAWAWLTQKKTPVLLLMSEIVSNGFMSLSHAIVLAFYASMVTYSGDGMFSTWWAKLFAISLLIPVSALLRRLITGWLNLIGIDEEKYAKIANSGLGGLFATAAIISGAVGGAKSKGRVPAPRTPGTTGPQGGGGGGDMLSFGTKADSSIESFTGTNSKDSAVKSANSWMASGSSGTLSQETDYSNLSPAESNLMNAIDSYIGSLDKEDEKLGGKLPPSKWDEIPTLGSVRGSIDGPVDENVFLGPAGSSTETYARKMSDLSDGPVASSGSEEKSSVHFVIPDPSSKAEEKKDLPGLGGIKQGTERYGGKLPNKYGVPSVNSLSRETNIQIDSNTFTGPAGASTKTQYGAGEEVGNVLPKIKATPAAKERKWPTMEQVAKTYNKALPALSTIGAVYGGLAGTAFGLPSGMPKSYQLAGVGIGRQLPQSVGRILNKAASRAGSNKTNKSRLDIPSIRGS